MLFDSIVIGGGIAGLLSSYQLLKQGKSVALIEKDRIGGHIKSVSVNGFTLEQGAATLSASQELLKLCEELNITAQLIYPHTQSYKQFVAFSGAIHQVPRNPWLLAKSKLFTMPEKLTLLRGVFRKFSHNYFSDDISIYDFLSKVFGRAVPEKLAAPVMRGIFGGDIAKLKAQIVFNRLFNSINSGYSLFQILSGKAPNYSKRGKICCFAGGNELLTNTLARNIEQNVKLYKGSVDNIQHDKEFFQISLNSKEFIKSKSVYIASNGVDSAKFLKGLTNNLHDFENINYAKISVFHVAVKQPNLLPQNAFGVLFPEDSDYDLLGILYNSKIFPHVAPLGYDLITLCFGGSNISNATSFTVDKYSVHINEALQRWLNIKDFEILESIAWQHAIPQYDDTAQALIKNQEDLSARYPGLFFVGSDVGGVGVPARIERVISITSL